MGILDKLFGPPSKDRFAEMVKSGIRNAGETGEVIYNAEEFTLRGENRGVLSLGNAYTEYCHAEKPQRELILKKWIRGWFLWSRPIPEDFEDIQPDLLPAVRGRAYFDLTELRMKLETGAHVDWPYLPLGEHLGVGLVYDMHESMRAINQADLDGWGITFYEALEIARENLRQRPHAFMGPESGDGVYLAANGDGYDGSRLIMLDVIRQFQVQGDHVALVPTRDTLLVAGSEDSDSLRAMLALARDALEKQPGPVSTIAMCLVGDDWEPWLPAAEHQLYNEFKALQVQSLGDDYNAQKDLLDRWHEKTREDLFVATFNAVQNEKSGRVRSYAVWTAGVPTLLPQVDVIAFVASPDADPQLYAWDKVAKVAPELAQPRDAYPPRYLVSEFPTDKQFAAMGPGQTL